MGSLEGVLRSCGSSKILSGFHQGIAGLLTVTSLVLIGGQVKHLANNYEVDKGTVGWQGCDERWILETLAPQACHPS